MKRKIKLSRATAVILAVGMVSMSLLFTGCGIMPQEEAELLPPITEPKKIEYKTQKVETGDIEKKISAQANIVSEKQYNLSFEYRGGYLKEIYYNVGDFVKEGEIIAELDNDSLLSQLERQKLQLRRAEVAYNEAYKSDDVMTRTNASINLQLEQLTLKDLENEISKSKIVAPCDGNIIFLAGYAIGDMVGARSIVCQFADPTKLRVVCTDDGKSKFALGDKVKVSYQKLSTTGKVVMTPTASAGGLSEEMTEILKNSLVIDIKNMPEEMKLGSSATITMIADIQKDVIVVPSNTIKLYGGKKYVKVLDDGIKVERIVETGIEDSGRTQIISGLEVGEDLIIN